MVARNEPEKFLNIVIGVPDDDCPICKAVREGKTAAEIIAMFPGAVVPTDDAVVLTLDLTD